MAWTQPKDWSYKEAPGSDKMNEQIRDNLKYLKASLPPGVMMSFAGSSAPTQWLLCDGSEVSRTTYSDLFAIIGTTYGNGDGSTTFNLPNRKGKVGVGVDTGQSEFDTLGKTGGEKTHTLSVNEMPVHTHTQNSHNHTQNPHTHTIAKSNNSIEHGGSHFDRVGGSETITSSSTTATNKATTATNKNTGGGAAHNNLSPYITVNYIIKT